MTAEFISLCRMMLYGLLILTAIKLTYVTADYMDHQAAMRAQATIEAATPAPGPCVRHYTRRKAGQQASFIQTCEDRP